MNIVVGEIGGEKTSPISYSSLDEKLALELKRQRSIVANKRALARLLIDYAEVSQTTKKTKENLINILSGSYQAFVKPYDLYVREEVEDEYILKKLLSYKFTNKPYDASTVSLSKLFDLNLNAMKVLASEYEDIFDHPTQAKKFFFQAKNFSELTQAANEIFLKGNNPKKKDYPYFATQVYQTFKYIAKKIRQKNKFISGTFYEYAGHMSFNISMDLLKSEESETWKRRTIECENNSAKLFEDCGNFELAGKSYESTSKYYEVYEKKDDDWKVKERYLLQSIKFRKKSIKNFEKINNTEAIARNYSFIGKLYSKFAINIKSKLKELENTVICEKKKENLKQELLETEKSILFYKTEAGNLYLQVGNKTEAEKNYSLARDASLFCYYALDDNAKDKKLASYLAIATLLNEKSIKLLEEMEGLSNSRENLTRQDKIEENVENLPVLIKVIYDKMIEEYRSKYNLQPYF